MIATAAPRISPSPPETGVGDPALVSTAVNTIGPGLELLMKLIVAIPSQPVGIATLAGMGLLTPAQPLVADVIRIDIEVGLL